MKLIRPSAGLDPAVHVLERTDVFKKTWVPTDQAGGLKAHGPSPAKGSLGNALGHFGLQIQRTGEPAMAVVVAARRMSNS
jgi:hypothetical protein